VAFPDVERALAEVIASDHPSAAVGTHLPADFTDNLPAVQIRVIPSTGSPEPWERTERVQIDIYATGRSEAKDLADSIQTGISRPAIGTSYGLLDGVYTVTEPYEAPVAFDAITLYSAIFRVDTRAF